MSTNAIVTVSTLDINKVSIGEIRTNKAGGKSVPIKYNGQNLQIRLPKTSYPMGISIRDTENGTDYKMMLTLKGCDPYGKDRAPSEAGEMGMLYNFALDLQDKLLNTALTNSTKWFNKARTREVLLDVMKTSVSPSVEKINGEWVPSGKYPPSLRMKVPVYDGRVAMDVVGSDGKPVEVDTENLASVFPKRVDASLVIAPSIYVTGQGFGITWRVIFAKVSPPQRLTAAQVFADEIEEEVPKTTTHAPEMVAEEEAPREEVMLPVVEEAPPPPQTPAAAKNRRRVAAAV